MKKKQRAEIDPAEIASFDQDRVFRLSRHLEGEIDPDFVRSEVRAIGDTHWHRVFVSMYLIGCSTGVMDSLGMLPEGFEPDRLLKGRYRPTWRIALEVGGLGLATDVVAGLLNGSRGMTLELVHQTVDGDDPHGLATELAFLYGVFMRQWDEEVS